ncbi:MAG TPA: glucose-6-phosphate isomerase, partial [Rhodanobacteraceae bacterium]|nr:glucose-6-phosphate isomerase [Rhodanobacteraceae bacterium]
MNMNTGRPELTDSAEWQALSAYRERERDTSLADLFEADPARGERFVADAVGIHMDYAKQRLDANGLDLLLALARARGLERRIGAMFAGQHVNTSEDRPALHIALRMPKGSSLVVDGVDVVAGVHAVLDRMAAFSEQVRDGRWTGHSG